MVHNAYSKNGLKCLVQSGYPTDFWIGSSNLKPRSAKLVNRDFYDSCSTSHIKNAFFMPDGQRRRCSNKPYGDRSQRLSTYAGQGNDFCPHAIGGWRWLMETREFVLRSTELIYWCHLQRGSPKASPVAALIKAVQEGQHAHLFPKVGIQAIQAIFVLELEASAVFPLCESNGDPQWCHGRSLIRNIRLLTKDKTA